MIYKDITKEKERRILKRNCCITLLKNLFPMLRKEKNLGILSEYDLNLRDGHTLSHYLAKVFPEPHCGEGGQGSIPDSISTLGSGGGLRGRLKGQLGLLVHAASQREES